MQSLEQSHPQVHRWMQTTFWPNQKKRRHCTHTRIQASQKFWGLLLQSNIFSATGDWFTCPKWTTFLCEPSELWAAQRQIRCKCHNPNWQWQTERARAKHCSFGWSENQCVASFSATNEAQGRSCARDQEQSTLCSPTIDWCWIFF